MLFSLFHFHPSSFLPPLASLHPQQPSKRCLLFTLPVVPPLSLLALEGSRATFKIAVSLACVHHHHSPRFFTSDSIFFQYDPLVQPALLRHEIVSSPASQQTIASARYNSARILAGNDDRILVIVGPCSIHSPEQAIAYAKLLASKIPEWGNLQIVMRAYL